MLDRQSSGTMADIPASFPGGLRWYVFVADGGRERLAHASIRDLGYEAFTPFEKRTRMLRNRRVVCEYALFVGYGFVRFDVNRDPWGHIVGAKGVWDVLRMNRVPVAVPDRVVDGLRVADSAGVFDHTKPPVVGMPVEITAGPFAGFLGKIKRARSAERMEVLVKFLNAEIAATVPLAALREA